MAETAPKLLDVLGLRWRQVVLLIGLGLVYGALEGVGLGLLLPVLQYVQEGPGTFGGASLPARFVRAASERTAIPVLPMLLGLVFIAVISKQVVRYVEQMYANRIRFDTMARARQEGFAAFMNATVPFTLSEHHARLVGALTTEIEFGVSAVPMFLHVCESAILLTVYLGLLFLLTPWLVPLVLLAVGALGLAMRARLKRSERYGHETANANQALHTMVAERLTGIRLLKLTGQENREVEKIRRITRTIADARLQISRAKVGMEVAIDPLIILLAFAAIYLAVASLGMTLASLGMFMFVLLRSVPVLRQFNEGRQGLVLSLQNLRQVRALVDRARASDERAGGAAPFPGLRQEITLRGVSFAYEEREPVLRQIDCQFQKGSLTALVGRSGAGKSTLLDLIPRLREPSGGELLFDGAPAKTFDVRSLRSVIGMMDQLAFLFDETIAGNIAYGVEGAGREEIVRAAQAANAHAFIAALPDGYDTAVGERGIRLSVGQRQRIALARVFLQNPDILLLDEPTSALDAESEHAIQQAIERLRRDKAVIIVAHRLSTIQRADQILVLEDGRIVERGDHATLLKTGEVYRELFGTPGLEMPAYA